MRTYLKELRVTYKRKRVADDLLSRPVKTSKQVYDLFREMEKETREKVVCLHLSPSLDILSYELVGLGSSHEVLLDVPGIFRGAILSGARSIVVVHNHPSGNLKPSAQDKKAAMALREVGEIHQIPLSDFIIIGEGYYSFDEQGLLK